MRIREFHSVPTKLIEVRSINIAILPSESLDVSVSKIISKNKDNVRAIRRFSGKAQKPATDNNNKYKSELHSLGYAKIPER